MKRLTLSHVALVACSVAVGVLTPIALASAWLARKARAGESNAELRILRQVAERKVLQRRGVAR